MTPETLHTELQTHINGQLSRQTPHPVRPALEVLWSEGYTINELCVRTGPLIERLSPKELTLRISQREQLLANEKSDPLRWICEPDMWRRIDLEMVKKRLAHPGEVLELLVTGGQRPGKTEGCTRRFMANLLYTPDAWGWALHQTDITSRTIQQKRVMKFLPPELNPEGGKMRRDKNTKFTFTAGTGFTGAMFIVQWDCQDETGRKFIGGGECDFRFYKQDLDTFQGSELTCATSDELIPLPIAKTVVQRSSTRAFDTGRPEFLARMHHAKALLEAGRPLPIALLGAIYHSVHIISFTPADGWTATVNYFMNNAVKYGWEISPDLLHRPGVQDPRVPRFAQPADDTKLVAYLFTSDNVIKPAYPALSKKYANASERDVRIYLHGDVDKDWTTTFTNYKPSKHLIDWKDISRTGTIFEVCDPAGAKPYSISWFLCDSLGRHTVVQEWPCESWEIEGHGFPGPWAVPTESDHLNGDKGPAQMLRLEWSRAHYMRLLWQGRRRIFQKMKETGPEWQGRFEEGTKTWAGQPSWDIEGPFVHVEWSKMDSRYAGTKTQAQNKAVVTVLEAYNQEENAIVWGPSPGVGIDEGNQLIQEALATEIEGLPQFMVNRECTNMAFTLATFVATHARNDEACKEKRDEAAYYLLSGPEDTENVELVSYA
jgi:hypothetical protein